MPRSRIFAMTGAGLAAAVMIATLFLTPGRGSAVQAATIFRNLRESAHRGLRFQLENIRTEGIAVDARVDIVFPTAITVAQILEDDDNNIPDPQAVYVEFKAIAGPEQHAVAGLNVEGAMSFSEADNWAFLKLINLPTQIEEEQPFLIGF